MSNVEALYLSPLRYPGGKGRLAAFIGRLIESQPVRASTYVEPFAGGAGVGLRLLFDEYVEQVVLNDLNPGIAAFWRAILEDTDSFLDLIADADLSVEEWHRQRAQYRDGGSDLQLGFATFYLNRTNRSGILDARPIGGLEQTGKWLIDARFNKDKLSHRVRVLSRYASRITVCEQDGVGLAETYLGDPEFFMYADPPYLVEGDDLYLHAMSWDDHQRLARMLKAAPNGWFLTYDADSRITDDL
ncbi:MAG TPA: DNA adenine methylase, partial [Solirubrobacteraceae bacterium]|nr:DNA adenine methylase [Solirubrobacteraceae bacterium]